ncbi:hypothetical protein [Azospirillum griseum]|uniref:Uncharacterized protein n=1 Tax=Azospirillum griseum TaxID=2496639 RepID=A0A3S0HYN3_9PROT|nr:hypothetical protein [Azospirillum griseum]RTR17253.1 hypothetical protein EJ903_18735 [Azospirillum griseum]
MPGPYFPSPGWRPFVFNGETYGFEHLNEYEFDVVDTAKVSRRIVVTFSDHVFTRDAELGDDPAWVFPGSSRVPPGCFCPKRYRHSLDIKALIEWAAGGKAWTLDGDDRYAQIPTISDDGTPLLYSIVFSLDPARGLQVHLHMRVRSAYPCDKTVPSTYGSVTFRHLVRLRAEHKRPNRNFNKRRERPTLGPVRPIRS